MPSRWVCLGIVLFWLAVNGWLFYHDLLPRLLPHQPPPYTIDLVEEAQLRRPHIFWEVHHNGKEVMRATTRVEHPGHDVFELSAEYNVLPGKTNRDVAIYNLLVSRMSSRYRVNGSGDLLGLSVEIEGRPRVHDLLRGLLGAFAGRARYDDPSFTLRVQGDVQAGTFAPRVEVEQRGVALGRLNLPKVAAARGGSVLLPLHPVNRIRGLRPGQSWHMALLDPLADSLDVLRGSAHDLRLLRARVRPEVEEFSPPRGRQNKVPCLVIDYEGDDVSGTTYVEREKGLVLAQGFALEGDLWTMFRD